MRARGNGTPNPRVSGGTKPPDQMLLDGLLFFSCSSTLRSSSQYLQCRSEQYGDPSSGGVLWLSGMGRLAMLPLEHARQVSVCKPEFICSETYYWKRQHAPFLGQRNCDRLAEAPGSCPSSGTPQCFPLALHDVQGMVGGHNGDCTGQCRHPR